MRSTATKGIGFLGVLFSPLLDVAHYLDRTKRACVIDAGTTVGRDLNRLFIGFIHREFGPDSFSVERVHPDPQKTEEASV